MEKDILKGFSAAAVLLAALLFFCPGTALSEEEPAEVTLEGLINEAVENNPRLEAARLEWKRVEQTYPQARSLDDPMLMYTEPVREVEERMFSLTQTLPFPGKRALMGRIAQSEAGIAMTRYEKTLRDLKAEVKSAYYDLYFIDRDLELATENKAVLDYFKELSRTNYGLDVSELDELVRAQMSAAEATLDLVTLKDMRQNVVARLNTLLDRPPSTEVGRTAEPEVPEFKYTTEDLYEWASRYNDEVRIAGLMVEKSELEKNLAGYVYKPDFTVGVNYSNIIESSATMSGAGEDAFSVTFGINVPLWFSRNKAAVTEKEIMRQRNLVERNAAVQEAGNMVKAVYFDLMTAQRIMRLYGEGYVPEAKESVEIAEARYRAGDESLGRLLETQSMWINFRVVYYRAVTDYLKSISEVERLTGREFTPDSGEVKER